MSPKWMGLCGAVAVCAALIVFPVATSWTIVAAPSRALADRVNPRPRLLFGRGEYQRFLSETTGARKPALDRVTEQIEALGSKQWNERDLQLETQALAARVLLDRRDSRGTRYLELARQTLQLFLKTHAFQRFSDSHALVTEGARWLEAMALAHDWLHPHWSATERSAIARWLREEIDQWVDTNRLVRASPSPFRNDAARGTSALVLAGLTLFDEPGYEATGRKALSYAQPFYESLLRAHTYAGAGGGMAEGTYYGNFTAWGQTLLAEALYTAAGVGDAFTRTPFFEGRLRYATHAGWPGYLTNQFGFNVHQLAPVFGDARRGPTGSALYHRATVLLLGKRFPGSAAARQAYWVVNRDETSRSYTREWALIDLLFWSPDVAREPPTALSYRESSLGQVFARSDWTDEATWISFNAGPHLDTHQHYDAGNLTIFRGVDLLVDSGSFDAFGSNHWYNYYARTIAHNTITVMDPEERWVGIWGGVPVDRTVNDGGQRTAAPLTPAPTLDEYLANRAAYDQGRIERYAEGSWGVYIRANLTNAYQNPQYQAARPDASRNRPKVTHVGREVVYLRRTEGRRDAVVVFDRVVSADPGFRKAVIWHAREPFESRGGASAVRVDEGEDRARDGSRYDFQTLVPFKEGNRERQGRLFVTAIAVDSIQARVIGRRVPVPTADHTTFNTQHRHRHVKDYLVLDPRGIVNDSRSTGALGRPEWPPLGPPEQAWLWNDDLVGGWGQSRIELEPAEPRLADRFLTVLVPSDGGQGQPPQIDGIRSTDGKSAGMVFREGSRADIVVFGADPNGAELDATTIEVPATAASGELTVTTLTPGASYDIRARAVAAGQQISIARGGSGSTADTAGVIRLQLGNVRPVGRTRGSNPVTGVAKKRSSAGGAGAAVGAVDSAMLDEVVPAEPAPRSPRGAVRHPGLVTVDTSDPASRRAWNERIDRMLATGDLLIRDTSADPLVPGRFSQHMTQVHDGVHVFGGSLTRQMDGQRVSAVYGAIYTRINVTAVPLLTSDQARVKLNEFSRRSLPPGRTPELVILPTDDGGYRLAYRARLVTLNDVAMYFVDANTGEPLLWFSDLKRPAI